MDMRRPEEGGAEADILGPETMVLTGGLRGQLARVPLLAALPPEALDALAEASEWIAVPGGSVVFEAGEPADALYCVLSGSLGVYAAPHGEPGTTRGRPVAVVRTGETIGEMSLLSGRAVHGASVLSLRDTELARVPRTVFDRWIGADPGALRQLAGLLADRLANANARHAPPRHPRTFALLPQSVEVDVGSFALELVAALQKLGRAELVWSVRGADHTAHWYSHLEGGTDFIVYVAEPDASPWSRLCARQADTLLLLARAEAAPAAWPALATLADTPAHHGTTARSELVLLHDGALTAGRATAWLAEAPGLPHHHVVDETDIARLARLCTGNAIGLVLGGGGARGFAHLGVVSALRRAGVPIDLVGGTSMGALLAAGVAHGWDDAELRTRFRRSFVDSNPLADYTVPIVSLVSGRKVSRLLRAEFGEGDIADLRLPFFCVSSNLTAGRVAVHRHGPLARSLRASIAIPGVLPPVATAGEVHVDGGAMNNLPVDVMRALQRGPVIGVDVGADRAFTTDGPDTEELPPWWRLLAFGRRKRTLPNIFRILWRAGMVNSAAAAQASREQSDLVLQPHLETVDMLDWAAMDRAAALGESCAEAALAAGQVQALLPVEREAPAATAARAPIALRSRRA